MYQKYIIHVIVASTSLLIDQISVKHMHSKRNRETERNRKRRRSRKGGNGGTSTKKDSCLLSLVYSKAQNDTKVNSEIFP